MQNQKVCFVALAAYPILASMNLDLVGGAEVQQVLLAKKLKSLMTHEYENGKVFLQQRRGFDISFVVSDFGQPSLEIIDDIKIFKTSSHGNSKNLRSIFSILKALNQTNANIFYVRGGELLVGLVAFYCCLRKKKLVYAIASDRSVDIKKNGFNSIIFKFALKNSHIIITQNEYQQKLLKKNFNKDGILMKSHIILNDEKPKKSIQPIVLWISTLKKELKQPELFLKLASIIPDVKFQMIGGPSKDNPKYFEKIKRLAAEIPNLEFIGFVPYSKIDEYFNRASIFVNTSKVEGFPNTFLQAWAAYTPVVSLNVDPDKILCEYKLGFHSKTFNQMVEDVKTLLEDEELRKKMGSNGREYVERKHGIKKITERYIRLFEGVNEM